MSAVALAAFAALDWEARSVLQTLRDVREDGGPRRWRGRLAGGGSCLVVQTGIGLARADAAARAAPPALAFLSAGCGGGLVPWLRTGDVVVATEVIRLDASCRPEDCLPARVPDAAESLQAAPIACSERLLATTARKTAAAGSGAVVVDMESWAVAAEAVRRGIPFTGVRVVLDSHAEDLPDLEAAVDAATGTIDPWRAARAVLLRPWMVPAALRLVRQRGEAAERLAEAVGALQWRHHGAEPAAT